MIRLYGLLFLIDLVVLVIALIDCLSTDEHEVRNLPKIAWVFIILLFSPVGWIAWFVAGRPQQVRAGAGAAWRAGNGFPEATRPRTTVAPDDDPEFLRGLAQSRREDQDLLGRWEADLRRREEELRKREQEKPDQ
ncbi:PLD nuclease N-terminal domain-containing protein [Dactylosporangium fulvum]|uniref:PLD nuclease N-terminal domain-containing protein n=1 Tax=Dactylosporangium fulvum TaxID=53359 RepID=A0ABY5W7Z3_9ACTN|nr:PLD nuclease N-terminal domain-containing protein [Dactylosporangium fulvum]UWP86198.1 PLD nuclease N-terminal domain-containing protein [Dactylosporangium fulvum]